MNSFDYCASAELFTNKSKWSRRGAVGYQRFAQAADAIRFAIESLPGNTLAGAWLEVGDDRFNASDIRRLYEDEAYPLARREPHANARRSNVSSKGALPVARRPLWWSRS